MLVELPGRVEQRGTVNSSETFRPSAVGCANLRWCACARFRPQIRQGFEARNKTLVAMAKSIIEREKAEAVEFREVN
jgi:hypothetical protein